MKTAIKLALIYLAMQILGALAVGPFTMIYAYVKYGTVDRASEFALAPTLLAGFVFMLIYLWQKGYLTGDKRLYSPVSVSYLSWSAMMGISMIYLIDFLMSHLTFLPDWLSDTFDLLQSGWLGIICVAILGPILEELLFRGAITKVLLKKYNPVVAILISGLIFGIFHMNPAQVVGATLIGFILAWIYYKTHSLIPCILIHIMNNSLSVYLALKFPDVEYSSELIGEKAYLTGLVIAFFLFILSWRMMNTYKLSNTTTEI
ncbi:MAG: CPBP family intramembrane metalloprotease [Bacteroides sp.]|jgi:hypothetical protein|uniref:CPBP family glutamic-type intramembrane protease n=1 Tax=Bacteroides TaxID=816 RepID=UPI0025BFB9D3|nr:type II CAAX endopeptidase family protein [Bacteroides sp.]MBS6237997.1 CPBP family intramembrane metalloprotease [Bacteroides sp.]